MQARPAGYRTGVRTIYLDTNATTPLDPAVREVMLPFLGSEYGNPSSVHHVGRAARAALDAARERLAELWQCKPSEIVFTSGGTESNNLAILGVARKLRPQARRVIVSAVEHHAVLEPAEFLSRQEGFSLIKLPVDREGRVNPEAVWSALTSDTALVSVMAANNEVGTIQPIATIGALCRENGVLFHTDAVQWFGKEPFENIQQFNADLVSVCAHKFYGPKGVGALYVRSGVLPHAILHGGGQENERRPGTENLAGILGLVEAFARFVTPPVLATDHVQAVASALIDRLKAIPGLQFWSPPTGCLRNTVSVSIAGGDSLSLLAGLDLEGVCASSGSACSVGSLQPSHVLAAMGATEEEARGLVRFSLDRSTTLADITTAIAALSEVVCRLRTVGQAANNQ